jgi:hypothetical protein
MNDGDSVSQNKWPRWIFAIFIFVAGVIIGRAIASVEKKLFSGPSVVHERNDQQHGRLDGLHVAPDHLLVLGRP